MSTIQAICPSCGITFDARSVLAVYCGVNCKCRAAYYRRQGRPIPAAKQVFAKTQPIRPQVIQPDILDEDDLPAEWLRDPAPSGGTEQRYWQGTLISRRQADGFVNATAMCKANNREWFTYARSARAQEYMEELASHLGVTAELRSPSAGSPQNPTTLVRTVTVGSNDLRGTWIHPRLAIDLARWISPRFAVWMDGWFLESIAKPPAQPLDAGIHVVAATKREAMRIWHEAIDREVRGAISRRLSPNGLTDAGVKVHACYSPYRFAPAG